MARLAITGAAGNVGRQAVAALDDHDPQLFTHREHDDLDSQILAVEDRAAFRAALEGTDVLVHLAANPSPEADWDALREPNVEGAYNAYEAAVANDLDRVVFASSNHAVGHYNTADASETEALAAEGVETVDPDDPPNPDSPYGVTKVAGEAFGAYYAGLTGLEVVNLRIGWLMDEGELREVQHDDPARARFARAIWLSPRDCRHALRRAVEADLRETPVTVHVTSRNDERFLSLTETATRLDYRPRDNATESLDA
ncbi:NAD-dependent epimerase/dehydratase family protein [Halobacteriales archaeon Cl-PHB]